MGWLEKRAFLDFPGGKDVLACQENPELATREPLVLQARPVSLVSMVILANPALLGLQVSTTKNRD